MLGESRHGFRTNGAERREGLLFVEVRRDHGRKTLPYCERRIAAVKRLRRASSTN
jgi:hypothetical protein